MDDLARLEQVLENSSCLWTAWDGDKLVGVARALSDFSYAFYLSDLAVAEAYQHQGIGCQLVEHLKAQMGEDLSLVLLAAPSAMDYYPKINFQKANNAFIIPRKPF
ncbi:GNAT family N-acetyltransferase [Streptococcus hyointestinalis]|uniref:GNAT family N-acetyltransferase n=1 Tax=Streptococcus hyointestinalis TaxID=1337 RepID=UPI0024049A83|nr:GNAT family N-acetyltransferase [Streptococcus hyointestinalis]